MFRLQIGWTGTNNQRLNVMDFFDEVSGTFTHGAKSTYDQYSFITPALGDFIADVSRAEYQTIVACNESKFYNKLMQFIVGEPVLSETSPAAPALIALHGKLIIAWIGLGNHLTVMDVNNPSSKTTLLPETSDAAPALGSYYIPG